VSNAVESILKHTRGFKVLTVPFSTALDTRRACKNCAEVLKARFVLLERKKLLATRKLVNMRYLGGCKPEGSPFSYQAYGNNPKEYS
jgi:hypothetical protein